MTPDQIGLAIARRFINGEWKLDIENLACHISSAIQQERERCAQLVETFVPTPDEPYEGLASIAAAIRSSPHSTP
jgi:hypothetical protein